MTQGRGALRWHRLHQRQLGAQAAQEGYAGGEGRLRPVPAYEAPEGPSERQREVMLAKGVPPSALSQMTKTDVSQCLELCASRGWSAAVLRQAVTAVLARRARALGR